MIRDTEEQADARWRQIRALLLTGDDRACGGLDGCALCGEYRESAWTATERVELGLGDLHDFDRVIAAWTSHLA